LGILLPQLFVGGEGIDHLRALALPLGVLLAVENAVGHVVGPHDRERHQSRDLAPRPGQAQDRPREDLFPGRGLAGRPRRFIRLRIIEQHQ
jgi:hypothetical protein